MRQQSLCVKQRNLTTSILFLKLCVGYQWYVACNTKCLLSASIPSLEQSFIICPISLKLILQQDSYYPHPIHEPSCKQKKPLAKDNFPTLAHLSGPVCIKQSATLNLPPLLKPPSRRICSITISKLSFLQPCLPPPYPSSPSPPHDHSRRQRQMCIRDRQLLSASDTRTFV